MTTLEAQPVTFRVKSSTMEERKRSATYAQDDAAPPFKRQATGANGTSRSRDQDADPELEQFQKEAALRQMQEYKRQKETIEKELEDVKRKSAAHDDHIRAIDAWFVQLLDEVRIAIDQHRDDHSFSIFPSSLLSSDFVDFEAHMKKRASQITDTVKEIFAKGHKREPSTTELQAEIAKLLATAKKQAIESEGNRAEKDQLEERLETASMRYMVAEKKIDRLRSQTVQKLERQMLASASAEAVKPASTEKSTTQETASLQALQDAEVALKAALAEKAQQAEQLEALAQEKQTLTVQLSESKIQGTQPSEDEFAQTDLFKQLKKQLEDFINRVNGLEANNNELRREAKKLQAERAAFRTELDAEMQAATSEHKQHLAKVEADLARIRTARDELEAEKGIRETSIRSDKNAAVQLKEMLAAREERVKALESELERSTVSPDVDSNADDIPEADLRARFAKTSKELAIMKQELESMAIAYKKLQGSVSTKYFNQVDLEEKLQRMSAEKAKADQKYFSAMKSKDTFAGEVKVLRAQNAKSSEMIASFKDLEATSRQQLVNLEKQVASAKEAFSLLENKHHTLQIGVTERSAQTEIFKKQVDELKAIVATKDTENSTTAAQLRRAEVELAKLKTTLAEKEKHFESFKKTAASSGGDSDVAESLRTMALCNVCRINFKDRVVIQCGHTFCKDCLDERLANRMRKCPNCNIAFGRDDVKPIVL